MQIYKIYINEKPLILTHTNIVDSTKYEEGEVLKIRYSGSSRTLFQTFDTLEKNTPYTAVILHSTDYAQLKRDVKAKFEIIKAGGGLVMDEKGLGLFIHRRGHWDLPKGKLDAGETYKVAASREVEEETGIQQLQRESSLGKTRHVYKTQAGKRVLKITKWYLMRAPNQMLVPQHEEDIVQAVWIDLDAFVQHHHPRFASIIDVINGYREL